MNKYKVYMAYSAHHYLGFSLIGATSKEEANEYILEFKRSDKDNKADSWGHEYIGIYGGSMDDLYTDKLGYIYNGIYYSG